jgi:hypothetical protein
MKTQLTAKAIILALLTSSTVMGAKINGQHDVKSPNSNPNPPKAAKLIKVPDNKGKHDTNLILTPSKGAKYFDDDEDEDYHDDYGCHSCKKDDDDCSCKEKQAVTL